MTSASPQSIPPTKNSNDVGGQPQLAPEGAEVKLDSVADVGAQDVKVTTVSPETGSPRSLKQPTVHNFETMVSNTKLGTGTKSTTNQYLSSTNQYLSTSNPHIQTQHIH